MRIPARPTVLACASIAALLWLSACVATVEPSASPAPPAPGSISPEPSPSPVPSPSPLRPPVSPPAGNPAPD